MIAAGLVIRDGYDRDWGVHQFVVLPRVGERIVLFRNDSYLSLTVTEVHHYPMVENGPASAGSVLLRVERVPQ